MQIIEEYTNTMITLFLKLLVCVKLGNVLQLEMDIIPSLANFD